MLQTLMALQQGCIADSERLVIAADVVEVVLAVSEGLYEQLAEHESDFDVAGPCLLKGLRRDGVDIVGIGSRHKGRISGGRPYARKRGLATEAARSEIADRFTDGRAVRQTPERVRDHEGIVRSIMDLAEQSGSLARAQAEMPLRRHTTDTNKRLARHRHASRESVATRSPNSCDA